MRRLSSLPLRACVVLITAATISSGLGGIASADDSSAPSASDVATDIQQADPAVAVTAGGSVTSSDTSAIVSTASDQAVVEIPRQSDDPVSLTTPAGSLVQFSLPVPDGQTVAAQVVEGTAVYSGNDGSSVAVQALTDGAVRAVVHIADSDAPSTYRFPIDVPAGGGLEPQPDGSVEIVGGDGVTAGVIAAPWAKDAAGADVPTSYSIDGDVLVQTVNFSSDTAFPVVADPTFQGDCGIVTCTVRLNRAATRNASDLSWILASTGTLCTKAGAGAAACAAAIGIGGTVYAVAAGRYYGNGNCLGIRFSKVVVAPVQYPVEVSRGSYNCS